MALEGTVFSTSEPAPTTEPEPISWHRMGVLLVRICGVLLVLSGALILAWQWRNWGMEHYVHSKATD